MVDPQLDLVLFVILIAIHIGITTQIYRVANDCGMNGTGWAILYFFTIPVGLVLFLLFRQAPSTGTGGSSMRVADPARSRLVDQRRDYYRPKSVREMLPGLKKGFRDRLLNEYMEDGDWETASAHVDDMLAMALGTGNMEQAEDYRRLRLWVNEKQNPFVKE